MPDPEAPRSTPSSRKHLRDKLFLAGQAGAGDLKVLPSDQWALHYPEKGAVRAEKLQGLLDGRYQPDEVADSLKPDALLFNAEDLETLELGAVTARIREITTGMAHYDWRRFAEFVVSMRGKDTDINTIQALYDGVSRSRARKTMIDAFGAGGKWKMEKALRDEAERTAGVLHALPRVQRVLEALKIDWLCEDLRYIRTEQRDRALEQLAEGERGLFDQLKDAYRRYVQTGDRAAYDELVMQVQATIPELQKEPESPPEPPGPPQEREQAPPQPQEEGTESPGMEDLRRDLEEMESEVGLPGMPNDPAIPPNRQNRYDPSPPPPGQEASKEGAPPRVFFEIDPPLRANYYGERLDHFDANNKVWTGREQLTPYAAALDGPGRYTVSGALAGEGTKVLPLPNGYALDAGSLKSEGPAPAVFRDQNGCFCLKPNGPCRFSVDFLHEPVPFPQAYVPEDLTPLYAGSLSAETEQCITGLSGSNEDKAEQVCAYVKSSHFYPGGGDLKLAQALQYKLQRESAAGNYIHNLDNSEYLECYSANTLFIAMMRKAKVPARIAIGHRVQSARDGKAVITETTGHAWAEIWDGNSWRPIDATPKPKPEDKKEPKQKSGEDGDNTPMEDADDGSLKPPDTGDSGDSGDSGKQPPQSAEKAAEQTRKSAKQTVDPSQTQPSDELGEASDADKAQAESDLEQAEQDMRQMREKKERLEKQMRDAKEFKELKDAKDKIEGEEDLTDDMKDDLREKLDAKEKQMKDEIKKKLDQMEKDGFIDENQKRELERQLEEKKLEELDQLKRQVEEEAKLHNEYEAIKMAVRPLVEKWFRHFAEKLPKKEDIEKDEDALTRRGAFDRRAIMKPRNLTFGTVRNPLVIKPSVEPRFMASIMLDVSDSMEEGGKLQNALKMLVFYSELFARISEEFGYIRFSVNIFSDSVTEIKSYSMDYNSRERYLFADNIRSTVKARLMKAVRTSGGTNMLTAIQKAATDLNDEVHDYPEYLSAFYFMGDGGDTCGNKANIQRFLRDNGREKGFGRHMRSAIMLGDESQKAALSEIFGKKNTTVAPDFEALVRRSMLRFDRDITWYMRDKTV